MVARSTSPSPSPETTTGAAALAVRTIDGASFTGNTLTGGGSAASAGRASCSSSSWVTRSIGPRLVPYPVGAPRPGGTGSVRSSQVGTARARSNRSVCRSARYTTDPTLMSRAIGAMADGSSTPSCSRRSSAFSRSAEAAEPQGTSSRATYGRSMSPGVIGSTVWPQRYAAKSAPGTSRTRVSWGWASSAAMASVQYCGMASSRVRSCV